MVPGWIDDAVRAFGRQLGLMEFALNEAGVAGVTFENGMTLRFESARDALVLTVGVPSAGEAQLKRILAAAHSSAQRGRPVRAMRFAGSGEDALAVRFGEREVSVDALSVAFRTLWEAVRTAAGGNA